MYGLSPIIYKVTSILIEELKSLYSDSDKETSQFTIDLKNKDLDDFNIDKILIINSKFNSYDHHSSGFKNGEYTSIIKLNLENLYLESVVHELKHAYIDNLIYQNGGNPISNTKEVKDFYTDDLERLLTEDRNKFPNLIQLISLYYYSSFLEIPSFLENHNMNPGYINYDEQINKMLNLDKLNLNLQELEKEFNLLKLYNIPFLNRFKDLESFYKYSIKVLSKRGRKIKKKILRINYEKMLRDVKNE